ncbi:hypothetical protein BDK92_7416 [Micromonospora pisi]|uniref:Uncharacterized protein n=1 Tax=Micromonospora pisi TaxID=589240 RepID=A0A495JWG5_9ACTN|nr:hypothetical protein [Micromonospora pisi]RKR92928.1 hypothetical protein BDK92_7416 [Micromonospora pisi]
MSTPQPERRWQVVYPLGRTDAMRAMGTVAAPLLAGFGLATLTMLITGDRPPRLGTVGIVAFAVGSTLFVFSIQFTFAGLLYAATPAERMAWEAGDEPVSAAAAARASDVQQKDTWLADRYFRSARSTYDAGILAHLCGLAAILVPRDGNAGRWIATGVVLAAIAVEVVWIVSAHRGRGPAWLLPGYRHARAALSIPVANPAEPPL